ncbi:MAG TPA: Obg family GTPase CgtA, partial [Candidatus Saccharimonadaceae bacterium]|nr:Obg family GTPase CgtA [Candidatus Saccharimonadaceae bacterium]
RLSAAETADAWTVEKLDDRYVVHGAKIEKFAVRTNFDQFEAVNRLRDIMRKMGISHELIRQGATSESIVEIGHHEMTLMEQ